MALKHGILGLLTYGEMTGYELMKTFNSSLAYFWHVRTSQIYLELDNLAKSGLVEFRKEIQESRPNKKNFKITNKGREEFKDWFKNSNMDKMLNIKNEFLMMIFFLNELPKNEAINFIKQYKEECKSGLADLEKAKNTIVEFKSFYHVENDSDIYWSLTVKHGEFMYEASMKWADYAMKIIKNKT